MSTGWQNFTEDEIGKIGDLLPELGVAAPTRQCPSCGEIRFRWYGCRNTFRPQRKISYAWCSGCRRYWGQTTVQERWDLNDPYEGKSSQERIEMESNPDTFFGGLDELWDSGVLPQVRKTPPRAMHQRH